MSGESFFQKLYLRHRNGLPQITQMTTDFISG